MHTVANNESRGFLNFFQPQKILENFSIFKLIARESENKKTNATIFIKSLKLREFVFIIKVSMSHEDFLGFLASE